jgi:hypothetical protein
MYLQTMLRFENADPMDIPVEIPVRSEDVVSIKRVLMQSWDGIEKILQRWFEALDMREDRKDSLRLIEDVTKRLDLPKYRRATRLEEEKGIQESVQQRDQNRETRERQLLDSRSARIASKLNNTFHSLSQVAYVKNMGEPRLGVLPLTTEDVTAFLEQENEDLQKQIIAFKVSANEAKKLYDKLLADVAY